MIKKVLSFCFFYFHLTAQAQTFNGTGGAIPDNGNSVDFVIPVNGLPSVIDSGFGVETVCINLTHSYDADLDIALIAPDGTQIILAASVGGSGNNFTNTCFNQNATAPITQGNAPFTGTFKPMGILGNVNNTQNPNGNWTLHILDTYPFADDGDLIDWNITFGNNPAYANPFKQSHLPIVIINTNGQTIPNDPKLTAQMGIIYNGPGIMNQLTDTPNTYNGFIGIEVRGSSSAGFPQKQYAVETRDSLGNNLDVSLLGMATDNDWILYAPYTDKSLMRNRLTYELSNQMGLWAIKGRYCEMVLNGNYMGVYELTETIKRDKNRLDIAKITPADTVGDELTGGYIVKIDRIGGPYWNSSFPPDQTNPDNNVMKYQCTEPDAAEILPVQFDYIQQYVDSFETAMASLQFFNLTTGWRKYADDESFMDYFFINELSKNVDGYRLSTFFHKDKDSKGGKIKMGPPWDYNLAWHNADYCNNETTTGWAYRITDYCSADLSFWWKRLMLDSQYKNKMKCRWLTLRTTVLDTTNIFGMMDSMVNYIGVAANRHFNTWQILGSYVWPNPSPLANTYAEEIQQTKNWIAARLTWMDNNLPGICNPAGITEVPKIEVITYPNPVTDALHFNYATAHTRSLQIKIYNAYGACVLIKPLQSIAYQDIAYNIPVNHLHAGMYVLQLIENDFVVSNSKFVKQ